MARHEYAPGTRFDRWTVLSAAPPYRHNDCWNCRCGCGTERVVRGTHLRSGWSPSCGCKTRTELPILNRTHGMRHTTEYSSWLNARRRCNDPKNNRYPLYGGRGIRFHAAWNTNFQAFFDHIGPRPSRQHSLDRIDPDGHYEPGNVRWATVMEQRHNRRPRTQASAPTQTPP